MRSDTTPHGLIARCLPIGYARVITDDQRLDVQLDALTQAGRDRAFEDRASWPTST